MPSRGCPWKNGPILALAKGKENAELGGWTSTTACSESDVPTAETTVDLTRSGCCAAAAIGFQHDCRIKSRAIRKPDNPTSSCGHPPTTALFTTTCSNDHKTKTNTTQPSSPESACALWPQTCSQHRGGLWPGTVACVGTGHAAACRSQLLARRLQLQKCVRSLGSTLWLL